MPVEILDKDDNIECFPKCNSRQMPLRSTPANSPETIETLHSNNERVHQFPYNYQQYNHNQITSDVNCNHSICNSMRTSNSNSRRIVKCSFEKELQAILREIRVITDKIRNEVLK